MADKNRLLDRPGFRKLHCDEMHRCQQRRKELHSLPRKEVIFVPVYKALYTSLREFLRGSFREFRNAPPVTHGLNSQADLANPKYDGYFKFSIARNPWDRVVSCYRDKIDRNANLGPDHEQPQGRIFTGCDGFSLGMSFEAFVQRVCEIPEGLANRHFKSQHLFVTDRKRRLLVDHVGRFETLDRDVEFALRKLGAGDVKMPHLMKSKRGHYRDYYTPRLRDLVAERYRGDIALFDYDF